MNEKEIKKQHEIWFKDEYPEDYLLFIHDASREALVKFVNSEKSWQAAKHQANKHFEEFIDQAIEDSACADERQSLQYLLDEFKEQNND